MYIPFWIIERYGVKDNVATKDWKHKGKWIKIGVLIRHHPPSRWFLYKFPEVDIQKHGSCFVKPNKSNNMKILGENYKYLLAHERRIIDYSTKFDFNFYYWLKFRKCGIPCMVFIYILVYFKSPDSRFQKWPGSEFVRIIQKEDVAKETITVSLEDEKEIVL